MDLKHITAFIAVVETGSINKAAQRLGISQPSTSHLVRALESEMGTSLFERTSRGTAPTAAAETLYGHFQRALAEIDAARQRVGGAKGEIAGPVKAGLSPTVTRGLLPDLLRGFLNQHPKVDLQITEAFSGKLIDWTLAGEIDLAVSHVPPNDRRLIIRPIAREPVVLIAGRQSGRTHLAPTDLRHGPPLRLAMPWSALSLRTLIDRFTQSGAIPIERVVEMDSLPGLIDFVAASDWVTLLPVTCATRELSGRSLIVQPISAPLLDTEFFLIRPARRTLSPAAVCFAEAIEAGFQASLARWSAAITTRDQFIDSLAL